MGWAMIDLYEHQKEIVKLNPARHLLAWGTGTGKTLAAIALADKNKIKTCLVICPKGLKTNWLRQYFPSPRTQIMSKEEFRRDWDRLPRYDAIIIDEAHTFASQTSQMSKNLTKYFKKYDIKYRWLLTATPYLRDPWNIYVLAKHLGHTINYMRFKETFFYDVRFGMRIIPQVRRGQEAKLKEIVLKIGSTKALEECVDVPEQTYETEYFSLTKDQKKAISEIQETNHITRWTMIHQICGGSLKEDTFREAQVFDSEKRDRLKELVDENPRTIVVCRYLAEIAMLAAEIGSTGMPTYTIIGDTKNRQEILDEINQMERYCLIVSASISEGWELAKCPVMIFYSYDFSLKNKVQMEGRIRRINALKKNSYISLVVAESIDEDVAKTLGKKIDFHLSLYAKD